MSWIKAIIDSDSVIYSDGIVAFIMKRVPNTDFMIAETPVTQALWRAIEGNNPSEGKDSPSLPVDNVSYPMAQSFIEHLNMVTGESFRLPTAFEWEMAAKCGDAQYPHEYAGTDDFESIDTSRHPVKESEPNEIGLYCLTGNVMEWTETVIKLPVDRRISAAVSMGLMDKSKIEYYEERILKGGSSAHGRYTSHIKDCNHYPSDNRNGLTGLRLAMDKKC